MYTLRYRQVHLDFHTSEKIPGVGSRFRREEWQQALQEGHIDSITIFSKCHHGLSYHDTRVGVRHPLMEEELLPRQIEACREIDVNCPVYISAGLDEAMMQRHPEWGIVGKGGQVFNPLAPGFKRLCFNTPYLDYLCAQIEEEVSRFDTNGIFLDIIGAVPCYCKWCLASMAQEGIDRIGELYRIDNELADLEPEARSRERKRLLKGPLKSLRNWLARTEATVLPKSPLGRAAHPAPLEGNPGGGGPGSSAFDPGTAPGAVARQAAGLSDAPDARRSRGVGVRRRLRLREEVTRGDRQLAASPLAFRQAFMVFRSDRSPSRSSDRAENTP